MESVGVGTYRQNLRDIGHDKFKMRSNFLYLPSGGIIVPRSAVVKSIIVCDISDIISIVIIIVRGSGSSSVRHRSV